MLISKLCKLNQLFICKTYLLIFLALCNPVHGDYTEFVMAYHSMPTTLDPHRMPLAANIALADQLYDSLFVITDESEPTSLIIESWELKNETTWVFHLKHNIYFHDGTPLTTKDIIYSFDRINQVEGLEYKTFTKRWKSYERLDDYSFQIVTEKPYSSLLRNLGNIYILKYQDQLLPHDKFMEQKGYMGSGPYCLMAIEPNGDIRLVANKYYHGAAVLVKKVRITRFVEVNERLRALQEGKINLAEGLAEVNIPLLNLKNIDIIKAPTHRLLHLHLDFKDAPTTFVRDYKGNALDHNPLRNTLVRKAISLAINRKYLVDEILQGNALIAEQYMLPNMVGYMAGIRLDEYNPELAKQLLKKAGYEQGFSLVLHGTNDRYIKDHAVVVAIAKMLNEIGIKTIPITLGRKQFFQDIKNYQYSAILIGFSPNGNIQGLLDELIHSPVPEKGKGAFNFGRYNNPQVDQLIHEAGEQFNQVKRIRTQGQAIELAMNDYALIPLYFEQAIWGQSQNNQWEFWPNHFNGTVAQDIRPK